MSQPSGNPAEVFSVFLRLGLTSFGGPVAHLGYFRAEFVERRKWLSERAFVDIVALSQFLPGPGSSQTGFAIGVSRAGLPGGLAAWVGFTLPSALLMLLFAYGAGSIANSALGAGLLHGLKLVAVAIVAQAVLGMARSLCPDRQRAAIAVLALFPVLLLPGSLSQIGVIVAGGLAGLVFCQASAEAAGDDMAMPVSRGLGIVCLAMFFLLLAVSLIPAGGALALWDAFYRSGALVFGGGHVVLPLLRDAVVVPGWATDSSFLAGYGAVQALPGPVFTFAAYLGAIANVGPGGVGGGTLALVAIFLPGMLAMLGTLPFWHALREQAGAQAAMRGINAAVVGILGAALYNPVWTSSVVRPLDFALAAAGFVALTVGRAPALLIVLLGAALGAGLGLVG